MTVGQSEAWLTCAHCGDRHDPNYDCRTYGPVCEDCGHRGDRRFRYQRPGVLRDVLAPSLGPDYMECSRCESANIRLEVVDA